MRRTLAPHPGQGGRRRPDLDALLEVMALGVTRVGATATKTIIDDFRARKAGGGPVATGAPGAAERATSDH